MSEKSGMNPIAVQEINEKLNCTINEELQNPTIEAANKVEKLIYNDTLTDFENRRGLNRFKNSLKPEEYPLLIIAIDLDHLKLINNKGGHSAGDKYILSFVEFVNEVFPNNKKFRLGGDEFVIPIKNVNSNPDLGEKISETMSSKLEVFNNRGQNQHKLKFTHATDIASSDEDFYESLKRADLKEVEAKNY